MTAPLFFVPSAAVEGVAAGEVVTVDGAEGHHAATVRRLRVGEPVQLSDGAGVRAVGTVASVERDRLTVAVASVEVEPPPNPRLVVVQALAKGERGELAVEMLTEVGVSVIVPWAASRSVTVWQGARGQRSLERWRATAREAAKQSRRARLPEVAELADTAEVCRLLADAALPVVLDGSGDRLLAEAVVPGVAEEGVSGLAEAAGPGTDPLMTSNVLRLDPHVFRSDPHVFRENGPQKDGKREASTENADKPDGAHHETAESAVEGGPVESAAVDGGAADASGGAAAGGAGEVMVTGGGEIGKQALRPASPLADVVLVVGPEGGISEAELAAFAAAGAGVYRLGSTVLRTSTAGVVAAAIIGAVAARH